MLNATAYLATLTDPAQTPRFIQQPRAFAAQTVRQTIRLRRGGTAVRLVLSNEFGREPLVIDEVVIDKDAMADGVPALYQGGRRWEIGPGQTATSDPVTLRVRAGRLDHQGRRHQRRYGPAVS
jgi:hypothetical protein